MADDAEEKVIVDVEVKDGNAEDNIKSINALTSQLVKTNDELLSTNKQLEEQGKKNSSAYKDNSEAISANEKAISKNHAEVKTLGKELKTQDDAAKKSKLSMQDFTGALDKAVPGLGGLINGIMGATKASIAFLATPIGWAIAALAVALGAVATYFTRTEEGGDKLAKAWAQLQAVAGVLLDRLAAIGGALVSLFEGNPSEAFNKMGKAVEGVADEIEREVKAAGELAELSDALEDKEISYEAKLTQSTNAIRKLMIESKNRSLTEQERAAKLEEAGKLEKERAQELLGLKSDAIKTATEKFQLDMQHAENKKRIDETDLEYARRAVDFTNETTGAKKELVKAINDYDAAEGQSLNLQERISNQIDAQTEKIKAKAAAAEEARMKQIENDQAIALANEQKAIMQKTKDEQDLLDLDNRLLDKVIANMNADQAILDSMQAELDAEKVASDKAYEKYAADQKKKLDLTRAMENAKLNLAQQGFAAVSSLMDQHSVEFKALAIAQTTISTYSAAQRAYESQLIPGDPTSIFRATAAAIFSVIAGLGRVSQIMKYEEGGAVKAFTIGGKPHSRGGTMFRGSDGTVFEAEKDEGLFILKKEAHRSFIEEQSHRNLKFGGRSWFGNGATKFALGGTVLPYATTNQASMNTQQLLEVMVAGIQNLPAPQVAVVDINAGQAIRANVEVNAQF